MSTLENLIANYYRIRNNKMNIEKYEKVLLLYNKIRINKHKFIKLDIWNKLYIYNKNVLPEIPPNKFSILTQIQNELNINYLDLIYNYYNVLDNCSNVKEMSGSIINELKFIIFILNKQKNANFKIDCSVWNQMRHRCMINKRKTKMPREPISICEIIHNINNIIYIN